MKKEYINPQTACFFINTEVPLAANTIDSGNLGNSIDNNGDANDGDDSDGRRHGRNTWEDFDDEEDEDY